MVHSACSVVWMPSKLISWACSDRPDVCTWYFSFCDRSLAPYRSRIVVAQIRRGDPADDRVLGVHAVGDQVGVKSSMCMPRARYASTYVNPLARVNASWLIGLAPASAMWYPEIDTE